MIDYFLSKTDFEKLADKECLYLLTILAHKKRYYLTAIVSIIFEETKTTLELKI